MPEPFLVQTCRASQKRFSGGNRKYRRREGQFLHGRVLKMPVNDFNFRRFPQVGLLEDEDGVLKPFLLDEIEQVPGGLGPRVHDRKDEEDKIRARDKTLGDRLMLGHHRVRARRVHHIEVL